MKNRRLAVLTITGLLALSASALGIAAATAQPAKPATPGVPPGMEVQEFHPLMDDIMTMLVQPRHIKLWYAGQAKNWQLAEFELGELGSALVRVGRTLTKYQNTDVGNAVKSIIGPQLFAMRDAVQKKDLKAFNEAYGKLTDSCNACHQALNHGFLVIKVPSVRMPSSPIGSDYVDEEFGTPAK